ncbi:hypothetical protein Sjap_005022 [Stephania japonica]|uniref:Uncharacterized protein n=1 Tax=Stephania japonica TaxID=461633 RepID=A0AAP0PJM7_9MAGN
MRNQEAEEKKSEDHETDRENIKDNSESPVTMMEEQIGNFKTGNGEMKRHPPITTSTGDCIEKLETFENWKPRPLIVLPEEFTENAETNYRSILDPALPIALPEECGKSSVTACPFGESWPDPCLEFAFKTLAGDISVEADFVIQNYFERYQSNQVPYQNSNGCVDKFLQLGLLEDGPASSTYDYIK